MHSDPVNNLNSNFTTLQQVDAINNHLNSDFKLSCILSFIWVLWSEIGDKTFILILVLKIKNTDINKWFSATFLSMFLIWLSSIIIGYLLDVLLYQSFINWLAICLFWIISINFFVNACEATSQSFEDELLTCVKTEYKEEKNQRKWTKKKSIIDQQIHFINRNRILAPENPPEEDDNYEPWFQDEDDWSESLLNNDIQEPTRAMNKRLTFTRSWSRNLDKFNKFNTSRINTTIVGNNGNVDFSQDQLQTQSIFWWIMKTIFIAEFGDHTQLGLIAMSSIYELYGVIVGALLALLVVLCIACFFEDIISKYIAERDMLVINGFVYFIFGWKIVYANNYFNIQNSF